MGTRVFANESRESERWGIGESGLLMVTFHSSHKTRAQNLFLLCLEGLFCLLKSVAPIHLSRGVRVGIHALWISHLLFANDCFVFEEASQIGADRLVYILEESAIFFSKNCSATMKEVVSNELNIHYEGSSREVSGVTYKCWQGDQRDL